MQKKSFLYTCIIISIFLGNIFCQREKDIIYWDKNRPLTWDDFKSSKKKIKKSIAYSQVFIRMDVKKPTKIAPINQYTISVKVGFNKKHSWFYKEGKINKDTSVLLHEQYHFNLHEVYARKLRKIIQEKNFKKKNVKKVYRLLKKTHSEAIKMQILYDIETQNSNNKEKKYYSSKQKEWQEKIDKWLEELDAYSNPTFTTTVK